MNIRNLALSVLVLAITGATFVAMPEAASSIAIGDLQLVGEAATSNLADGSCPTKSQHTCGQQSVHTGAFGTVPAPQVADGSCPTKSQHTCSQQSVHTGAFGTVPAPQMADGSCPTKSQHTCSQQSVNTGAFGTCPAPRVAAL